MKNRYIMAKALAIMCRNANYKIDARGLLCLNNLALDFNYKAGLGHEIP